MSEFVTTLKTEQLGRTKFKLLAPLHFRDAVGDVVVPTDYITDYASLKALHNIILYPLYALMSGYGNYASTVHDYLYGKKMVSRKTADKYFYRALRAEGVAQWRSMLFYVGVRLGGWRHY
ncbi:hypothetical protein D3C75_1003980 [compost metagenome]